MNAITGTLEIMSKAVNREMKKKISLTVNHKDSDIARHIMNWLHVAQDITGRESHLVNEPLCNLLPDSELIKLEDFLSRWYDENITLHKDLKFINKN